MQEPIKSLEDVEDKKVELIEDSQLESPTKGISKQVPTSSLNNYTPSILRRRLRLSSQHPPEYIISDPTKGIQSRSSFKNICAFSTFVSLVEWKDVKEAKKKPIWIIVMQSELNEFERKKYGI